MKSSAALLFGDIPRLAPGEFHVVTGDVIGDVSAFMKFFAATWASEGAPEGALR